MKRLAETTVRGAVLVAILMCVGVTTHAGFDVDLGVGVRTGEDTDLYVTLSGRYFDRDEPTVQHVARRVGDPDDVAVALFLCARSGRSIEAVLDLRSGGLSWWDVSVRLGVGREVWFVPVRRDPGPPYGKAYGHWKKHGRDGKWSLRDGQARDLVAVRVLHEYYGLEVEDAMDRRANGDKLDTLMIRAYRERHDASTARSNDAKPKDENDHGKGSGKGNGKGKSSG